MLITIVFKTVSNKGGLVFKSFCDMKRDMAVFQMQISQFNTANNSCWLHLKKEKEKSFDHYIKADPVGHINLWPST